MREVARTPVLLSYEGLRLSIERTTVLKEVKAERTLIKILSFVEEYNLKER